MTHSKIMELLFGYKAKLQGMYIYHRDNDDKARADAVNECLDVFIDLILEIKVKQPNNVIDKLVKKSK